jgi:molybdate transport system substrate-binding protein
MKRALASAAALVVLGGLLLPGSTAEGRPDATRLTVYAAASLTEVFRKIAPRANYSFGGSNQLAFQIRQGAPADVFASASPQYTQELFRERVVERPVTFASNRLVLAVPRSNPAGLRTVFDLRRKDVRLVVGTPQVPVGSYTRQVLRKLGMTGVLSKVVSQEPDVKSIVGKVALGEADAGFVYATDVTPVKARVRAIRIPPWAQPKVRYEIAVVRRSANLKAARAWVRMVDRNARARRLLKRAGFGLR